jgi:hypothetical protein
VILGLLGSALCVFRVGDFKAALAAAGCGQTAQSPAYSAVSASSPASAAQEVEMSAADEADQPDEAESEGLVPSSAGGSPHPRSSNSSGLQRCAAKCSGLGVAVPFVVLALTSEFRCLAL